MDNIIDNVKFMNLSGEEYFKMLNDFPFDFDDIDDFETFTKHIKNSLPFVSNKAKRIYKNLVNEEEGRELKRYLSDLMDKASLNINARKYANLLNMDVTPALNANYTFDKCLDAKQKKKLEKDMKTMKELNGLFDNINKSFRKYALWCVLFCAVCPPAIFAMGGVISVIGLGLGGTELLRQAGYNDVVRQLECNGKNPYRNYHYAEGYKKIEKLTQKEISLEDILKAKDEKEKNPKDDKAKENFDKVVKDYLKGGV